MKTKPNKQTKNIHPICFEAFFPAALLSTDTIPTAALAAFLIGNEAEAGMTLDLLLNLLHYRGSSLITKASPAHLVPQEEGERREQRREISGQNLWAVLRLPPLLLELHLVLFLPARTSPEMEYSCEASM